MALKKTLTACTKDCPGSCSIVATVDEGQITSLKGNPDHAYTQGFLCPSTSKFLQDRFYNPQRILHPLIKKNGEWEKISWEEALKIAANKISETIQEHGVESILYYQGFGARTALRILNRRFFNLLGGASTLYGTVCGGTGQAGQEMDLGPSSIITGWGLHRYLKGHLTFRMIDALAAVSGNLGISGGGVTQGFDEFGFFDDKWAAEELAAQHRQFPMPTIGQAILEAQQPVKLIFLTAGNPVAMCPNSGKVKKAFESADFVIMVDQFLNDTSKIADLFLPATTFLEDQDLLGAYGHHIVSPLNPVVVPQGECKSELWIFQQLANILGFGEEMAGTNLEWLEKLADPILKKGFTLQKLLEKPLRIPGPPVTPYADKQFFTESGKFQFISQFEMDEMVQEVEKNEFNQDNLSPKDNGNVSRNMEDSGDYTLRLLSIMPEKWVGSEIPHKEMIKGHLEVKVNPQILEGHGFKNGDLAILESKSGSLEVKILSDPETRKDCVSTYRGGWIAHNKCINVLTEDLISEKGNGTPYYETMVRIRKISDN